MARMKQAQRDLRARVAEAWRDYPSYARILAEVYLATYPEDGLTWAYYGDSLRAMGAFTESRTALSTARGLVEKDETKAFVLSLVGDLERSLGRYQEAEKCYREALALEPQNGYRQLDLGIALRRQCRDPEAEACYRTALTLTGDQDVFLLNLGYLFQARGSLEEAADCFEKAVAIDPDYKEARHSLDDVRRAIAFLNETR